MTNTTIIMTYMIIKFFTQSASLFWISVVALLKTSTVRIVKNE
jgi:hypothetical protein